MTEEFLSKLDILGYVPVIGNAADGISGLLYFSMGDTSTGMMYFAFTMPGYGDVARGGVKGTKAVVKVTTNFTAKNGYSSPLRTNLQNLSKKEDNFIIFNKTHKDAQPKPRGRGPNGGRLQSHHALQDAWAKENLSSYGYNSRLAPTITIETNKGFPHTTINNNQNKRRNDRIGNGEGKWSSNLQDELGYIVSDMESVGFSKGVISRTLEDNYKMLDKINVPYERIKVK